MEEPAEQIPDKTGYWILIRDVAVLQVKLLIDGFRDLVLLPAALVAGLLSLFGGNSGKPGPQFYRLLALGKQSERWINLFGALRNSPEEVVAGVQAPADIDDIMSRVETFLVDEYRRGGVTKQAKDRIDRALEGMQRRRREPGNKQ